MWVPPLFRQSLRILIWEGSPQEADAGARIYRRSFEIPREPALPEMRRSARWLRLAAQSERPPCGEQFERERPWVVFVVPI